mgnify:CR=1 FL=1
MEEITKILEGKEIFYIEKLDFVSLVGIKHEFYWVDKKEDDKRGVNIERAIEGDYRRLRKNSLSFLGGGFQKLELNTYVREKRIGHALFLGSLIH